MARNPSGDVRLGSHLVRSEAAVQSISVAVAERETNPSILAQSPFPVKTPDPMTFAGVPMAVDTDYPKTRRGLQEVMTTPEGHFIQAKSAEEVANRLEFGGIGRVNDPGSSYTGTRVIALTIQGRTAVINTGPRPIECNRWVRIKAPTLESPDFFKNNQNDAKYMVLGQRGGAASIPGKVPWFQTVEVGDDEFLRADDVTRFMAADDPDAADHTSAAKAYYDYHRGEVIDTILCTGLPAPAAGAPAWPAGSFEHLVGEYRATPDFQQKERIRTRILTDAAKYRTRAGVLAPTWHRAMSELWNTPSYRRSQGQTQTVRQQSKLRDRRQAKMVALKNIYKKAKQGIIGYSLSRAEPGQPLEITLTRAM